MKRRHGEKVLLKYKTTPRNKMDLMALYHATRTTMTLVLIECGEGGLETAIIDSMGCIVASEEFCDVYSLNPNQTIEIVLTILLHCLWKAYAFSRWRRNARFATMPSDRTLAA